MKLRHVPTTICYGAEGSGELERWRTQGAAEEVANAAPQCPLLLCTCTGGTLRCRALALADEKDAEVLLAGHPFSSRSLSRWLFSRGQRP